MEKQNSIYSVGDKAIRYLTGALCGAVVSVILSLIFALFFTLTPVSESFVSAAAYIVFSLSAFLCGLISVLRLRTAGLINGFISGTCFFVLYAVFSLVFGSGSLFSVSTLIMLVLSIIFSTLGGILAVNIR